MNQPAHGGRVAVTDKLFGALERYLHIEALSGVVLLIATLCALVWANSPWADAYDALWHLPVGFSIGGITFTQSLHFLINDALMTVFFLVVGLEIRREIHEGALSNRRAAALPVVAAAGGVAAPALIYAALNSPATLHGWAVPTATDIAFAVGVLALLGKRIPATVRILLLALAIIDDIVAILVIALFYSEGINATGLWIAASGIAGVLVFQQLGVRSAYPYILPGAVLWSGLLVAGVHPTLAGVALGLLTPVRPVSGREDPLGKLSAALDDFGRHRHEPQHATLNLMRPMWQLQRARLEILPPVVRVQATLHPWVAYGIMPLFALANAGVSLDGLGFTDDASRAVGLGIIVGLVLGKPLGIVLSSWLAVRLGVCELPRSLSWRGVLLVGLLGGIGFTMAVFIANLAFGEPELLAAAKLAVLLASALAGAAGLVAGAFMFRAR